MVRFSLKNPYTILVASLMILVVGVFAMLHLPLDVLPTFHLPAVMVVTTYTGMPAEQVEADITFRMERWLSQAAGLDHIDSKSMIGLSILNLYFAPGYDPNNALAQTTSLVASDLHYLPPGTLPPIVLGFDPTASLPVALATVYTPRLTPAKLWDETNYVVRTNLNAVQGAVAPVVFGGTFRQIMIYLDKHRLANYGLSPLSVVDALKTGNEMLPTGDAKIGSYDYSITSNGLVPQVKGFNDIPIRVVKGAPIFIGDVGKAKDSSAIQTNVVQVNGVENCFVPLYRRIGANTLQTVKNIRDEIPRILNYLPLGTELKLAFDQSPNVRDAVYDVIRELFLGIILASLVIYLFLGTLMPTLIASLVIPLSFIGGMVALYYMNQSLNLMTLGGLALVTGPLIDNAVVVLENIERHMEMGAAPAPASEKAANEVVLPVLVAVLGLSIVFYPVTFFQGLGRFLFTPLALSVVITEILSYFIVMTVVPLCASRFFKPHDPSRKERLPGFVRSFNEKFRSFHHAYAKVLEQSLAMPKAVVGAFVVIGAVSLALIPFMGSEFFPVSDHGQFYVRMRAEPGTRIELTKDLVSEVSASIHRLLPGEVDVVLSNAGTLASFAAAYTPNTSPSDAILEVGLKEGKSAKKAIKLLRPNLTRLYPTASFSYSVIDPVSSALNYGSLYDIDLQVSGGNLEKDQTLARRLLKMIGKVPGLADAFVEQTLDYPALHIDVHRSEAGYLGLTVDEVIKNVITALNSSVLFSLNFWDDPVSQNNYMIGAQYPEKEINSIDTIYNIPIIPTAKGFAGSAMAGSGWQKRRRASANTGQESPDVVLLRNVAAITPIRIATEIHHYNIERTFDIYANAEGRDIGSVAADIDKVVKALKLPRGYEFRWAGVVRQMRDSFGNMGVGMILALVLIFLLMVAQLRSFIDPLIILSAVPLGFVGSLWLMFLTNTTFNIQSLMGMIMLIGIMVSNTVILTDFANQRLESGLSPKRAIQEAGLVRIRPILMTALSAVMALSPSAIVGVNAPLARAVIGGLLVAMPVILIFLPCLYTLAREK